jgi:hypothetical protein
MPDQLLGRREAEVVEERERAHDGHARELVDRDAADRDRQHLRLESRALAGGARAEAHVLLDPLALLRRVRLLVTPLERRHDAFEGHRVRAAAAHLVAVGDVEPVALRPVEEQALLLGRQVAPGRLAVDLVALEDGVHHRLVEVARPRRERLRHR